MVEILTDQIFEDIVETIREPLLVLNSDLKVISANRSFYEFFKVKPEETMGQLIYDLGNKQWNISKLRELLETILPEKNSFDNYEVEHDFATIGRRIMLLNARQIKRGMGEERIILLAIEDITERKQAEKNLRESEARQGKMVANIGDVIAIIDQDGINRYKSPNIEKLFGWKPEDVVGVSTWDNIHPDDIESTQKFFEKILSEPEAVGTMECRYRCKGGSYKWIEFTGTNFLHDSDINGLLGNYHDITERKKFESQVQQAQKMEAIGTLAGGIAHDFNNILSPIVGYAEMLLEDIPDDSPYRESISEIYTGSLRARDLVHQILAFSRQGSSELNLMKMQPIIKEALKLIRSTIPTTISINQSLQPNCGAVKADPTQIHQIVMNLTTNSYHAMEETGGELKVSLKEVKLGRHDVINPDMTPGLFACLTIADTGMGMDKNLMDKIFEPFFTTKEIGKGTGMGLSMVHGIVKSMNGDIKVHSEPGKGTEFHVFLPIVKSSFETQEIQTKEPLKGGTERILLVDDEKSIIALETRTLNRLGYQVTSRESSIEALEAFRSDPDKFDIVITDMAMPNMPGDKLAVELGSV